MRTVVAMLRCSSCRRCKHPEEYNMDTSRKSGRQRKCRTCCKTAETPRNHKRVWTNREERALIEGASRTPEMLAQRLGRTEKALDRRLQVMGLTGAYMPSEEWGNRSLGKLLGRAHSKLIQRWAAVGLRTYQVGNRWKATSGAIRDFFESRPEAQDLEGIGYENLWMLGIEKIPSLDALKVIVCVKCGAINKVKLHAKGNCIGCTIILGYWATHGYEP